GGPGLSPPQVARGFPKGAGVKGAASRPPRRPRGNLFRPQSCFQRTPMHRAALPAADSHRARWSRAGASLRAVRAVRRPLLEDGTMKRVIIAAISAAVALVGSGYAATQLPVFAAGDRAAGAKDAPQFLSACRYSHRAPDDPIVYPDQPG